jgi:hypothetical protein
MIILASQTKVSNVTMVSEFKGIKRGYCGLFLGIILPFTPRTEEKTTKIRITRI